VAPAPEARQRHEKDNGRGAEIAHTPSAGHGRDDDILFGGNRQHQCRAACLGHQSRLDGCVTAGAAPGGVDIQMT